MIYLRPQPAATPVDYMKSLEKAGLIVMPKQYLGIYTCKAGPNIGPQGPQGTPGIDYHSLYDTSIASASDEATPLTVSVITKTTFRAPYAMSLATGYIRASLTTAPTGADLIVDVHMNGVTMFSTLLRIDATEKTSVTSAIPAVLSTVVIPDDAEFTVFVTQVGSSVAGAGLKVALTGIKVA